MRCCSVAVLQFQNRLYESQKLTLYLCINIEVFLGYGNTFKRTATLQQVQQVQHILTPHEKTHGNEIMGNWGK